jgi:hypothetical protein
MNQPNQNRFKSSVANGASDPREENTNASQLETFEWEEAVQEFTDYSSTIEFRPEIVGRPPDEPLQV